MKRQAITAFLFSLFLVLPFRVAAVDYGELKEQFGGYDSPAYYKSNLRLETAGVPEKSPEGGELSRRKKELDALKERWSALIERVARDKSFFDFESEQAKKVRKIAGTEKIKELLQGELDLALLTATAFERNPGLQAAKTKWAATLERYSQAVALDNILQQYNTFVKELDTRIGRQRQKQPISQYFPFPGTLSLKGDIISKEVEIARQDYRIALRDLLTHLKVAYYQLTYLSEAIRISNENLKLLRQLERTAFVKYKTGQAGYSDVIKVQVRISKLDNDIAILKEERTTVIAKLNQLLDLPPEFPLGAPRPAPLRDTELSLAGLLQLGLRNQQEIKRLRLEIGRTNLAIELAEKKFYPDFTLGFSYFQDRAGNLLAPTRQRETFSLKPVQETKFWFGKNEAYIREARLHYQALQKQLLDMENKLRYGVKEQYFQLDTARRNVALYRDSLLKLAENALQVAETEYLAGKIDFLNVLDAQAVWLDYNLIYQAALRDQNQSLARLEQVVGTRIPTP